MTLVTRNPETTPEAFNERWERNAALYGEDIVTFGQEQWVVKDTGELIKLEPHQKDILRLFFTRGGVGPGGVDRLSEERARHLECLWDDLTEAGQARMRATPTDKFPWEDMIYSTVKKSGKSEVGGLVGLWVPLSEQGVNEAFFVANDQEQSMGRGYMRIVDHLNPSNPCYNPVIASLMRTRIKAHTRPPMRLDFSAGDFIRAIPTDYGGEAGANPTISVWDEIWAFVHESLSRLWEEFTVVPTRRNSVRFVTTYAGFREESELLWNIYLRTVRQGVRVHKHLPIYESQEGDTVAYWDSGVEARRMPWQTPEYYRKEEARLRRNAYLRLHHNQWTRSESAFIDPERYEALYRHTKPTPRQIEKLPVYIGGDASHKRDSTAGVAVAWSPEGFPLLVDYGIWTPSEDSPVIPEDTLGPWIEKMHDLYDVRLIGCDPNHMETLIYRMKERGFPIEEFQQTMDNLTSAGDALYTFIAQRLFIMYEGTPDLDRHILAATAKETPRGWKLSKELARHHIDGAVALGTALSLARQYGPDAVATNTVMFFLGGSDDEGGW